MSPSFLIMHLIFWFLTIFSSNSIPSINLSCSSIKFSIQIYNFQLYKLIFKELLERKLDGVLIIHSSPLFNISQIRSDLTFDFFLWRRSIPIFVIFFLYFFWIIFNLIIIIYLLLFDIHPNIFSNVLNQPNTKHHRGLTYLFNLKLKFFVLFKITIM